MTATPLVASSSAAERFKAHSQTIQRKSDDLFEAIERGDHGQVWRLIRDGANLRHVDEATGLSPLAFSIQQKRIELARMLVEAGADANWGGTTTPLEAAALEGDPEMAQILIEAGAEIDRRVDDGFTPLMTAAALGHRRVCQRLLVAGARPLLRNDHGQTAVGLAEDAGHAATADLIRSYERKRRATERHGAAAVRGPQPTPGRASGGFTAWKPVPTPAQAVAPRAPEPPPAPRLTGIAELAKLLDSKDFEGARRLVEKVTFEPESLDADGRTPLILAARAGAGDVVALLLGRGIQVDRTFGADKENALTQAIQNPTAGRLEVIELLHRAGANLEHRVASGVTPLHLAASTDVYHEKDGPELGAFGATTELLIELGANLEAQDDRGNTVWRQIKRAAMGAPTFSPYRRRLYQMLRLLEQAGAQQLASHQV
jgi:ankyrin repeat protein